MTSSPSASASNSSGLSLTRRLAEGSSAAWSDLVELYGPLVDRWCRRAGVPRAAIADLAQETFLATFRGIHRFDPSRQNATFRGWLWTVTRSRIQDYFRRTRGADQGVGGSTANTRLSEVAERVPIDEPSESTDVVRLLRRAMSRVEAEFEPRTWQMFQDVVIAGRDTSSVAEHYGISPAAVRQAKSRVLRRLRLELGDA